MTSIHYDAAIDDARRRELIYRGDLFVCSPSKASMALVELAREMLSKAFGTRDPETAQYEMNVEEFARLLGELKPRLHSSPRLQALAAGDA